MRTLLFQAYDHHLERLAQIAERVCRALDAAHIDYRVVGGLAVLFHVQARDPMGARLTKDVDLAVDRADLPRIADVVRALGLQYRHVAGVDMLVDVSEPRARTAVHLIFVGEKVRAHYLDTVPRFSTPVLAENGVRLASVADLVRMKLTSFRPHDKAHLIDMDAVKLITPEIEMSLPDPLRQRLAQVRDEEAQSTGAE